LLLNPFVPLTLIVLLVLAPPTSSDRLLAEDERLNPGTGMVSVIFVELVAVPELPVTITGYVPGTAVVLALKVRLVVCGSTVAKAAVTPAGRPDAARFTPCSRPMGLMTVTAIGRFHAFSPTKSVKLPGEDVSVKLGPGLEIGTGLTAAMAGMLEPVANNNNSPVTRKDLSEYVV